MIRPIRPAPRGAVSAFVDAAVVHRVLNERILAGQIEATFMRDAAPGQDARVFWGPKRPDGTRWALVVAIDTYDLKVGVPARKTFYLQGPDGRQYAYWFNAGRAMRHFERLTRPVAAAAPGSLA